MINSALALLPLRTAAVVFEGGRCKGRGHTGCQAGASGPGAFAVSWEDLGFSQSGENGETLSWAASGFHLVAWRFHNFEPVSLI